MGLRKFLRGLLNIISDGEMHDIEDPVVVELEEEPVEEIDKEMVVKAFIDNWITLYKEINNDLPPSTHELQEMLVMANYAYGEVEAKSYAIAWLTHQMAEEDEDIESLMAHIGTALMYEITGTLGLLQSAFEPNEQR